MSSEKLRLIAGISISEEKQQKAQHMKEKKPKINGIKSLLFYDKLHPSRDAEASRQNVSFYWRLQ